METTTRKIKVDVSVLVNSFASFCLRVCFTYKMKITCNDVIHFTAKEFKRVAKLNKAAGKQKQRLEGSGAKHYGKKHKLKLKELSFERSVWDVYINVCL